jgi:hypothetical protein
MSKRTWICVPCRKTYLRKKSLTSVECPNCHGSCEGVRPASRVPSPRQTQAWDKFLAEHNAYKAQMEACDRAVSDIPEAKGPTNRPKRSAAKPRETYLKGVCTPLIKTLNHSAALPAHHLAGHAANFEFWLSEATHCLAVIDGYSERFARLRAGQARYKQEHGVAGRFRPVRRTTKDLERQVLRRAVCEAIERFLSRCHREGLLTKEPLRAFLRSMESAR